MFKFISGNCLPVKQKKGAVAGVYLEQTEKEPQKAWVCGVHSFVVWSRDICVG